MKLGKLPAVFDPNALRMKSYISSTYTPPPSADNTWGITSWGMMLNDDLGDCTIASCGHAIQVWTHGKVTPPNSVILSYYEKWCGYVPSDPLTDQGGVEAYVLQDWQQSTFSGHVLEAYVAPQPQNFGHVQHSIAEFGGIYIGLQLPNSAIEQNERGQLWDVVPNDGGIAGGHAVYCPAYMVDDAKAHNKTTITCITWGGLQKMTVEFWDKYCEESHTLLSADWSPAGFNVAQLRADLASVSG
jgi:hypothetical protein